VSQTRRTRKTRYSGAATEPEHRQSFNRWRQFEPIKQQGVEARNGKSGDRIGHDHIDVVQRNSGCLRRFDGQFLKQIERMPAECLGALFPTMRP